jgi:hypothetical protein
VCSKWRAYLTRLLPLSRKWANQKSMLIPQSTHRHPVYPSESCSQSRSQALWLTSISAIGGWWWWWWCEGILQATTRTHSILLPHLPHTRLSVPRGVCEDPKDIDKLVATPLDIFMCSPLSCWQEAPHVLQTNLVMITELCLLAV